jgi:hypothetical protein
MHRSPQKPDPYCQFKDDDQRRRALNYRCVCYTVAVVAIAVAAATTPQIAFLAALRWVRALLH